MIEVTLNKNLFPCSRPTFPVLHPLRDLTEDLEAARVVISTALRFFYLEKPKYSGFARKIDAYDGAPGPFGPVFYVQLWDGDELFRTVGFRDLGYVGILHVEAHQGEFAHDLIGEMCESVSNLPEDYAQSVIGYVSGGKLDISVPYIAKY